MCGALEDATGLTVKPNQLGMMSTIEINGLHLPQTLIRALEDGTWAEAGKDWFAVFPPQEIGRPELFRIDLMRQINGEWRRREMPVIFYGVADGSAMPGALDPERSLLIGEVENEALFGLDYRDRGASPSVVFLNTYVRWVEIAGSFDEFWRRLTGGI